MTPFSRLLLFPISWLGDRISSDQNKDVSIPTISIGARHIENVHRSQDEGSSTIQRATQSRQSLGLRCGGLREGSRYTAKAEKEESHLEENLVLACRRSIRICTYVYSHLSFDLHYRRSWVTCKSRSLPHIPFYPTRSTTILSRLFLRLR
jgi:hypothetical protein